LVLGGGGPVELRGPSRLAFKVGIQYRLVEAEGILGPWRAQTVAYSFELVHQDGARLLAYHWHPSPPNRVYFPHLHFPRGCTSAGVSLSKIHAPTGRVCVEEVIRLAIEEFGVQSLKDDWDAVLRDTQKAHEAYRTWGGRGAP
jgi:hypothetical protein